MEVADDIYAIHEGKVICYYMKEKCINGIVVAYCILFLERGHKQVVAYCILLACNWWDPIVFASCKHLANIWQTFGKSIFRGWTQYFWINGNGSILKKILGYKKHSVLTELVLYYIDNFYWVIYVNNICKSKRTKKCARTKRKKKQRTNIVLS